MENEQSELIMTKREALEITKRMWSWLARHPDKEKRAWPGLKKLPEMSCDCACCEYADTHVKPGEIPCHKCPLYGRWGSCNESTCTDDDSPFGMWCRCPELAPYEVVIAEKAKHARAVARLCNKELKRLK